MGDEQPSPKLWNVDDGSGVARLGTGHMDMQFRNPQWGEGALSWFVCTRARVADVRLTMLRHLALLRPATTWLVVSLLGRGLIIRSIQGNFCFRSRCGFSLRLTRACRLLWRITSWDVGRVMCQRCMTIICNGVLRQVQGQAVAVRRISANEKAVMVCLSGSVKELATASRMPYSDSHPQGPSMGSCFGVPLLGRDLCDERQIGCSIL